MRKERGLPRIGEKSELILRLVADGAGTGTEVVERSEGRVGLGTVYWTLERLRREGLLVRQGRQYAVGMLGVALLWGLDAALKVFRDALADLERENEHVGQDVDGERGDVAGDGEADRGAPQQGR